MGTIVGLAGLGVGPGPLGAQACPAPPQQAPREVETETRVAVARLARVTGGDLSVRTRQTVRDLMTRLPDANRVYLEQMLFAAYCSTVRDDRALTPTQRADRLNRYAREVRATLNPPTPAPPDTGARRHGDRRPEAVTRGDAAAARRERARAALAFEGFAATDTAAFFRALREEHAPVVRLFLTAGVSPNVVEPVAGLRAGPPLALAAVRGNLALVDLLLDAGARPDLPNRSGYTPLLHAAGAGNLAVVRRLLARGADATHVADDGATALHEAAEVGDTAMLAEVLRALPAARRGALLAQEAGQGMTPLGMAVREGREAAARLLLRAGAPAGAPAAAPPLCVAVHRSYVNVADDGPAAHRARYLGLVRLLIEAGGAPADPNCDGHSVLAMPARMGDTVLVVYLLARGADPNRAWSSEGPPLVELAGVCDEDAAAATRFLLARGARAEVRWADRGTPLVYAAALGRRACADLLLAAGANANARDEDGATPLLWAAQRGDTAMLAALLARGADPRAVDRDGDTALMRLVTAERARDGAEPLDAAALLLRAGVDRAARRADGRTALDLARANRYCETAVRLGGACAR